MNANRACTPGASPSYLFILQKFPDTIIPDKFKIFDHAHIVFGSISFVQMFQIVAWEISAFKTKLCTVFEKNFAILDFTSNAGDWFIDIHPSATGTFIIFSQIGHTNAAVHTAGSYKRIFIQGFHGQILFLFTKVCDKQI